MCCVTRKYKPRTQNPSRRREEDFEMAVRNNEATEVDELPGNDIWKDGKVVVTQIEVMQRSDVRSEPRRHQDAKTST